jgi:hypothetical protein
MRQVPIASERLSGKHDLKPLLAVGVVSGGWYGQRKRQMRTLVARSISGDLVP